jgi:hypothetical protein
VHDELSVYVVQSLPRVTTVGGGGGGALPQLLIFSLLLGGLLRSEAPPLRLAGALMLCPACACAMSDCHHEAEAISITTDSVCCILDAIDPDTDVIVAIVL